MASCLDSICRITNDFHDCLDLYLELFQQTATVENEFSKEKAELRNTAFEMSASSSSRSEQMRKISSLQSRIFALSSWQRIAARTSAIQVYDIYQVTHALNKIIKSHQTIKNLVDLKSKNEAAKLFSQVFPHFGESRNVSAHYGEFYSTKEKVEKHSMKAPLNDPLMKGSGTFSISGMMDLHPEGCIFSSTVNGKLISSELSFKTANVLENYSLMHLQAFSKVIENPLAGRRI